MKLRSGFTYSLTENDASTKISKPAKITTPDKKPEAIACLPKKKIKKIVRKITPKPIIKINKHLNCSICQQNFNTGDIICSCNITNINKHCFHKECLRQWIRDLRKNRKHPCCPYCLSSITGRLKYVKIE